MPDKIIVLGAGGHAKVVVSAIRATGNEVTAVYDDDSSKWGMTVLGVPVLGGFAEAPDAPSVSGVVAVGSNAARRQITARFCRLSWLTVVHPTAYVDPSANIGPGTVVFAGAVVQPEATLGEHVIVNTGATVDHDAVIADYVHIAPGAHVAGGVHIGMGALLGIGSAVVPGRSIGAWSVVGAGGVVVQSVSSYSTVVGVPARQVQADRDH